MKSTNIQRIRFCRIPLLLGLIVSGLMIARVPLNAFTSKPDTSQPSVAAGKIPTGEPVKEQEPATANLALEQPIEVAATAPSGPSEADEAAGIELSLPGIELDDAQHLLQQNKGLVRELFAALPSAADLIPRTSSLPSEEPTHTATPPAEDPATDLEPKIVLRNPVQSGGLIRFLIGDQVHELQPSDQLTLAAGEQVLLRFHRGEEFGNAEHLLRAAGRYDFVPTDEGWVLSTNE